MATLKLGAYTDAHLPNARSVRNQYVSRLTELRAAGLDFVCTPLNLSGDAAFMQTCAASGLKFKLEANGSSISQSILEATPSIDSFLLHDDCHTIPVGEELATLLPPAALAGNFPSHFTVARQNDLQLLDRFANCPGDIALQCYCFKSQTILNYVYQTLRHVRGFSGAKKVIAILGIFATADPWEGGVNEDQITGRVSAFPEFPNRDFLAAQLWAAHAAGADEAWFYSLCEFGGTAGETLAQQTFPYSREWLRRFFAYHHNHFCILRSVIRDYKRLAQYPVEINYLTPTGTVSLASVTQQQKRGPYVSVTIDGREEQFGCLLCHVETLAIAAAAETVQPESGSGGWFGRLSRQLTQTLDVRSDYGGEAIIIRRIGEEDQALACRFFAGSSMRHGNLATVDQQQGELKVSLPSSGFRWPEVGDMFVRTLFADETWVYGADNRVLGSGEGWIHFSVTRVVPDAFGQHSQLSY